MDPESLPALEALRLPHDDATLLLRRLRDIQQDQPETETPTDLEEPDDH